MLVHIERVGGVVEELERGTCQPVSNRALDLLVVSQKCFTLCTMNDAAIHW